MLFFCFRGEITMQNETNIRYFIEHQLTRDWFFQDGEQFVSVLIERGELYPQMVRRVYEDNHQEYPFTDDQFAVHGLHVKGDVYCVFIKMPEPEAEADCLYILMFFDRAFEKTAYYTVENSVSLFFGQTLTYLCEWTKEGEHRNYMQCSDDPAACLEQCRKLYFEEA